MKSCLTPADGMRGGSAPIAGEPMWTSLIERRMEESMAGQRQKKSKTKVAFIDARDLPETSTQLLELDGNVRRIEKTQTRWKKKNVPESKTAKKSNEKERIPKNWRFYFQKTRRPWEKDFQQWRIFTSRETIRP